VGMRVAGLGVDSPARGFRGGRRCIIDLRLRWTRSRIQATRL